MADDYIQISSIDELDLAKITTTDLHKRYIDAHGNRYAVKFDFKTRKCKLVQLIKGRLEAEAVRNRKKDTSPTPRSAKLKVSLSQSSESTKSEKKESANFNLGNINEEPGNKIDLDSIFPELRTIFKKTRERLKAIENGLRISCYFDKENKENSKTFLTDLDREIDSRCIKKMDEASTLVDEMEKYPRPLGYYFNRLSIEKKDIINNQTSDDARMKLVKQWELQDQFLIAIKSTLRVLQKLQSSLSSADDKIISELNYHQRQPFDDAKMSASFTINELKKLQAKVLKWQKSNEKG